MTLLQIDKMSEYVRTASQSPEEVTALADDLMIHVTGFFRDPGVWESLKQRVIRTADHCQARQRHYPVLGDGLLQR